jgi:glucan phosphoethanolaminetransferase (alkaline phosphatase superfamily)
MSSDHDAHKFSYITVARWFIIWGILETLVFILTKGDQFKSLTVYISMFAILSVLIYALPEVIDFL